MAISPARVSPRIVKTRSAARTALHNHQEKLHKAQEVAADARKPFERAFDQHEHAKAAVRSAESTLAAVDAQEAALIGSWDAAGSVWPPPSPSAELKKARADADDALAVARRALSTVERNMETASGPADRAAAAVTEIAKASDSKIRDVVMEEGDAALARLADAMTKAAKAKSAVISLADALLAKGWLTAAEHINTALFSARTPMPPSVTAPFVGLISRLATDADAALEI
jgi:hypothetical protein